MCQNSAMGKDQYLRAEVIFDRMIDSIDGGRARGDFMMDEKRYVGSGRNGGVEKVG